MAIDEYEKHRLSKPLPELNPWKYGLHQFGELTPVEYDKLYGFKKEIPKEFYIKGKFRIPKKEGDYFNLIL